MASFEGTDSEQNPPEAFVHAWIFAPDVAFTRDLAHELQSSGGRGNFTTCWCKFQLYKIVALSMPMRSGTMLELVSANWPLLQSLKLSQMAHLDAEDTRDMLALSARQWPQLKCLRLVGVGVGASGAEHLVNGQWPQLEVLDLSSGRISEGGMKVLVEGCLASLEKSVVHAHSHDK